MRKKAKKLVKKLVSAERLSGYLEALNDFHDYGKRQGDKEVILYANHLLTIKTKEYERT